MDTVIDYKRQTLLFNPADYEADVIIVGLGNIGSHSALTLARLGVRSFVLYDFDTVEVHNLTSQGYDINDLTFSKAECLAKKMRMINPGINVLAKHEKYEGQMTRGILIVAVDTMAERKRFAQIIAKKDIQPELIIDARVGGSQLEIYNCKNVTEWAKTFVDNPSQDPCGGRFICYTSVVTGALITNQVKRFLKGEKLKQSILIHLDALQIITE